MDLMKDDQYIIHNITNVDTLTGLSLLYNTDINIIKKVNNMTTGDIWSLSYLMIPKNAENTKPKTTSNDKEYYQTSKNSDNIKLLKKLTNEDDNIVNIVYDHTEKNFKKSLKILEEISILQKKHNLDSHTILAYYLVYSDADGATFEFIENKILESTNKIKFKNEKKMNFLKSQNLEEKYINNYSSDTNINNNNYYNYSNSARDFINISKIKDSLIDKSSQSFSYVKSIFRKTFPLLNSDLKTEEEEIKEKKKKNNKDFSETSDYNFFTSLSFSSTKKKNDSKTSEKEANDNDEMEEMRNKIYRSKTNGELRRRT